jgi:exodeoxyribonuclease V alpha subunit
LTQNPKIPNKEGSLFLESISGTIEGIVFHNEENGFSVLKVKIQSQRDPVIVVCQLPYVNIGESITAEGKWVKDKNYGTQFRAENVKTYPPTTKEGIEKYLASGLIKGIGPVYARKLIDHFGEKVIDIIENQSARLEEVEGIGQKRRKIIKAAWEAQKAVRSIMIFLYSHGIGTSRAVRIYKTYGDNAIELIRENPYRLAIDIPGIGFKTADQIALKVGIPRDSHLRVRACLNFILMEAIEDGHCALPEQLLKEKTAEYLNIDPAIIDSVLSQSLAEQNLIKEKIGDQTLIYLPSIRHAEEIIAEKIAKLVSGKPPYPPIDVKRAIEWYSKKFGKELGEEQKLAVEKALTNKILIITGGPGVGKTTIVHSLIQILKVKNVKVSLCAPTGRAAKRLSEVTGFEAKTIHRLLEINPATNGFVHNESNPLDCNLLIVDESSMVDIPLMCHLIRAVPLNCALILVGDVDQLPSVGPGTLLRDLINSGIVPVAKLTKIYRQSSTSQIIVGAHQINNGEIPQFGDKSKGSDFYFIKRETPESIIKTITELISKRIPEKFGFHPVKDIQVLCPMNRGSLGIIELNRVIQDILNPLDFNEPAIEKFGWQFRLRDKVMQMENNYEKDVFNGDIGFVEEIDLVDQQLIVRFDQRLVEYDFSELDELSPAYAITIHKSQGSEFPAVIIPLATQQYMLLQRNLIYTAVTRGKKLVVIVGQPKALSIAIKNNRINQRFSGLLYRLQLKLKIV